MSELADPPAPEPVGDDGAPAAGADALVGAADVGVVPVDEDDDEGLFDEEHAAARRATATSAATRLGADMCMASFRVPVRAGEE